ncbi:MAG: DUF1028 domain-containing protein [candidate division WOR-3 bacterium]
MINFLFSTFSIIAIDTITNEIGIGTSSKVLAVGYLVPYIDAEYGVIATQSFVNVKLGKLGIELLKLNYKPEEVFNILKASDSLIELRQIGILNIKGEGYAYTGSKNLPYAGHIVGKGYVILGNLLKSENVLKEMEKAFLNNSNKPLAERLILALEAGEKAGGDKRGKQSAAIIVKLKNGGYDGIDDRLVDIRVDDNKEPISEIKRIYELWQYEYMLISYIRLYEKGFEKNIKYLLQNMKISKNIPADSYNNVAWELCVRNIYQEVGLEFSLKAHKLSPKDTNIMDTVAKCYESLGNYKEALNWLKRALSIEKDNLYLKSRLEEVERMLNE